MPRNTALISIYPSPACVGRAKSATVSAGADLRAWRQARAIEAFPAGCAGYDGRLCFRVITGWRRGRLRDPSGAAPNETGCRDQQMAGKIAKKAMGVSSLPACRCRRNWCMHDVLAPLSLDSVWWGGEGPIRAGGWRSPQGARVLEPDYAARWLQAWRCDYPTS